jgi:hypothetical protein
MKNAAISIKVVDWRINEIDPNIADVDLEFSGSFQDDNGQVVFNQPEPKTVRFDLHPETSSKTKRPQHTTGIHPLDIRSDPRRRGPI